MTTKTKTNVATFEGKAESIIVNEGGVDYKHAVVRGNILSLFSENGDSPWKSLGGSYTLFHLEEGVSYRVFVDLAAGEKDMRPEVTGELVGKWTYLAQPTKHEEKDSLGVWDDGVMVIAPVGAKNPLKEGKQYQVTVVKAAESTNIATFEGIATSATTTYKGSKLPCLVVGNKSEHLITNIQYNLPMITVAPDLFELEKGVKYRVSIDAISDNNQSPRELEGLLLAKFSATPSSGEEAGKIKLHTKGLRAVVQINNAQRLLTQESVLVTVEQLSTQAIKAPKNKLEFFMHDKNEDQLLTKIRLALSSHDSIYNVMQFSNDVGQNKKTLEVIKDAGLCADDEITIRANMRGGYMQNVTATVTVFPYSKLAVVEYLSKKPVITKLQGFFQYLHAKENINKFAIESTLDERTRLGLRLLENFAKKA